MASKTDTESPSGGHFMTEITRILMQDIQKAGVIPFSRFMEVALYCPEFGYYEQKRQHIGRAGDYYTSTSVGTLFGELLAFQLAEWLQNLPATLCLEAGAHDGQLALDILTWLSQNRADLFQKLEYWLLEPSPTRQQWQRTKLEKFADQVFWAESFDSFAQASLQGVIFSNELLDAFPVHRLVWNKTNSTWSELGVGIDNQNHFIWHPLPPSTNWLGILCANGFNLPDELLNVLPDGFTIDFSPSAGDWWRKAAGRLTRGKLLTIDYGFVSEELLDPARSAGTLRSYSRHHLASDPLAAPGEQDLTAHVNFTQLQQAGESASLRTEGLLTQSQFLSTIAQEIWTTEAPLTDWSSARLRQFQTLTHPGFLGHSFRVLLQSR